MRGKRPWCVLACSVLAACATTGQPLPDAASTAGGYSTDVAAHPPTDASADGAVRVVLGLVAPDAQADGRLAAVAAEWLAAGDGVGVDVTDIVRRHGLPDVAVRAARVRRGERFGRAMRAAAFQRFSQGPATHYGMACDPLACGLIVTARRVDLGGFPARLPADQASVDLHARVLDAEGEVTVEVERPDAALDRYPCGDQQSCDVRLSVRYRGLHRVRMWSRGRHAPVLLASMRLFVGDGAPSTDGVAVSDSTASAALLARVNAARALEGHRALQTHPGLTEAATRAALDPAGLGPAHASRLRSAGFVPSAVATVTARAASPGAAHAGLMGEPSHRAQLLASSNTHVGIGVVRGADGRVVVTELFARLAPPLRLEADRTDLLARINRVRATRGVDALVAVPELQDVAQAAATSFLEPPFPADDAVVQSANAELQSFSIAYRRLTAVLTTTDSLQGLAQLSPLLDPTVSYVGVGLGRGDHPRLGVGRLVAVFALGYGRR